MTEPSSSNTRSRTSNRKGGSEGASSEGIAPPPPLHAALHEHVAGEGSQEGPAGEQDKEDTAQEVQEEGQEGQEEEEEEELFPELQLELPTATHVKVKQAAYISSCVKHQDCPPPKYPEFAVIGRSNVGKSSLINMITNSKKLAHVSKEPGKTRCINHFLINKDQSPWYLVDLPGYGYARVSKDQRVEFDQFTKEYFTQRKNLVMVFLLIDASIKPQKVDLEYASWLTDNNVPFAICFTKTDKRRKGMGSKALNIIEFKRELLKDFEYLPPSIVTSSENGTGKTPMLHMIASLRTAATEQGLGK